MPNLQTACFRQPYKSQCMDGKRSQYTIRWFAMGSSCMSYPYGYCPENEVSHVTSTMRTRKACEELCIKNGSSLESQTIIKPSISELVETIPLTQSKKIRKAQIFFPFVKVHFNYRLRFIQFHLQATTIRAHVCQKCAKSIYISVVL